MLEEIIKKNRSYRRFDANFEIQKEVLINAVDVSRFTPSARNQQVLKFKIVNEKKHCDKIFPHLKWAGYLKDWDGPKEKERPTGYILICIDKNLTSENISHWVYTDLGIVAQTILLKLTESGLGGCMIGSINKKEISSAMQLPENLELILVLAIGKTAEDVIIVEKNNLKDIKYWRDGDSHFVPKRTLEDIILF